MTCLTAQSKVALVTRHPLLTGGKGRLLPAADRANYRATEMPPGRHVCQGALSGSPTGLGQP